MTELLERPDEETTVSGRDLWRSVVAKFEDGTPLTVANVGRSGHFVMWANIASGAHSYVYHVRHATLGDRDDVVFALLGPVDDPAARQLVALTMVEEPFHDDVEAPAEHPGTTALRDLQAWINMPLDAIVTLAGLSPSIRSYWRQHPTAPVRPTQGGRLLRLHTAVGLIVGEIGLEQARSVLHNEGWLTGTYDEKRIVQLEVRLREVLLPEGLQPPAYLTGGGLTREQLRARVLGDTAHEHNRQTVERSNHRLNLDGSAET